MDMITVEMVLEKGFDFVAHDVINVSYPENDPDYEVIGNAYLDEVNEKNQPWHDCDVKEFAWRDNEGEMPCDGELWVEIEFKIGGIRQIVKAEDTRWRRRDAGGDIIKWRPSFKNWEIEMNLDKIETQEEKEAFEGMANSSEVPNSSEWDGVGIPPIGTSCDVLDVEGKCVIGTGEIYHIDGEKAFILSKDMIDYPDNSTITMFDGELNLYVMWVGDDDKRFRKPETPEQKADRERLEEINEISNFIVSLPTSVKILPNSLAERLHDAGYRKQNG